MKGKILAFIIGLLVGAIIATAAFLIYQKSNDNTNGQAQMQGGPGGQMMDSNSMPTPPNMDGNSMGEPPAKPDGDNSNEIGTPPDMPDPNGQFFQEAPTTSQENNS